MANRPLRGAVSHARFATSVLGERAVVLGASMGGLVGGQFFKVTALVDPRPACSAPCFFTGLQPSTGVAGNAIRNLVRQKWLAELTIGRRYQTRCRNYPQESKARFAAPAVALTR